MLSFFSLDAKKFWHSKKKTQNKNDILPSKANMQSLILCLLRFTTVFLQ